MSSSAQEFENKYILAKLSRFPNESTGYFINNQGRKVYSDQFSALMDRVKKEVDNPGSTMENEQKILISSFTGSGNMGLTSYNMFAKKENREYSKTNIFSLLVKSLKAKELDFMPGNLHDYVDFILFATGEELIACNDAVYAGIQQAKDKEESESGKACYEALSSHLCDLCASALINASNKKDKAELDDEMGL